MAGPNLPRRRFLAQSVAALASGPLLAVRGRAHEALALRELAQARGLFIGPAAHPNPLAADPNYGPVMAREFTILTPENHMKWGLIHPGRYQYNFTGADALVKFALRNDMTCHGHTLIWHNTNPGWLTSGSFTRDEMIEILAEHIYTVAGRYSGMLLAWDVVNEAFNPDGSLRSTLWSQRIGPDYLDLAFYLAADADPNAYLVYNDYGAEGINAKSNAIYSMVVDMLERGVPIHGVGFQMHTTTSGINYASFGQNLRRFADLGMIVLVTEMDVRMQLPVTPAKLAMQANVYRNVLQQFLNVPGALAFQTWGFTDRYSWVPASYPGWGAALPLDADYAPKPAYDALAEVLAG
jgi:endo-1,4-beta-xylanase